MSCLLLRLEGPLQSWGYRSRFSDRDTGLEPTKSGVVGLLCCALGRDRTEDPATLAALRLNVRVDRQGRILTDYHTVGGGKWRGSPYKVLHADGSVKERTSLTERHYLADAAFLVALEGDAFPLKLLHERLADPEWPLALGRRSCPPSVPVWLADGLRDDENAAEALGSYPLAYRSDPGPAYRMVFETEDFEGDPRRDVPVAWSDRLTREYAVRYVRPEFRELEVRP